MLYLLTTIYTLVAGPARHARTSSDHPWAVVVVLVNVLAIANIPRGDLTGPAGQAFLSSCCAIAALVFLFGAGALPQPRDGRATTRLSLTIYNAASSPKTLTIMLIIALIGMPFVLAYTAVIYWTFRGKVRLDETTGWISQCYSTHSDLTRSP